MDRHNILYFQLNPTLTIVRLVFRRVVQCESKGVQSAVQRCQGYSVLDLQTRQDLCVVQGTGAGKNASQLLKASCASYAKGLRSLQRSTGPFASHSLCLLCAGGAKNAKQPEFYVEPFWFRRMSTDLRVRCHRVHIIR